jgi:hypothetical protein
MWSEHDVFLEHHRRYTLGQLSDVLERAGLTQVSGSYFFGLVMPLAWISRKLDNWLSPADRPPKSQLRPHGRLANTILDMLCRIELPWFQTNRIAGLTAIYLARKP